MRLNVLNNLPEKGKYMALERRVSDWKKWQKLKRAGGHLPAKKKKRRVQCKWLIGLAKLLTVSSTNKLYPMPVCQVTELSTN